MLTRWLFVIDMVFHKFVVVQFKTGEKDRNFECCDEADYNYKFVVLKKGMKDKEIVEIDECQLDCSDVRMIDSCDDL